MREIKFRAWGSNEGRMWNHAEIDASDKDGIVMWGEIFNKKEGGFAVMQYTGLKDKNGVEIYEGDILRAPQIACIREVGEVRFESGSFVALFDGKDQKGWPLSNFHPDDLRVIGNIHQHAELLEAK